MESSWILGPPEPSLPARPHMPLQQQSRGQHQGPKVRGPTGLPGFAVGAWPTSGVGAECLWGAGWPGLEVRQG